MKTEFFYRMLLTDKNGRIMKDTGLLPSHSFVIQFLELMRGWHRAAGVVATDVNGAETNIFAGAGTAGQFGRADAAAGDATHGVVVGTNAGGSPESNTDYKLDTKILHSGTGEAGKLNYQANTFVYARVVGANVDLDVTRAFLNETGSTITIKEIGIIVKNTYNTTYHLIMRDVVSDFAVLAGYTLTVVYTLRTTV